MIKDLTQPQCPSKVRIALPVSRFQTLIRVSRLPLTKIRPSGLIAKDRTRAEYPINSQRSFPEIKSHTRIVVSQLQPEIALPLGLRATESTKLV